MQNTDLTQLDRLRRERQALVEVLGILKNPAALQKSLTLMIEKVALVLSQTEFGAVMLWDQAAGLFRPFPDAA